MTVRNDLVASIVATVADYHDPPSPDRVERWVRQFDDAAQIPILFEMDYVLKRTYFSRSKTRNTLVKLLYSRKLVNGDPHGFWKGLRFLQIQNRGDSQNDMLQLFDEVLQDELGFGVDECGVNSQSFAYFDDAVYTGNRVKHDLKAWVESHAPSGSTIYIITIALHSNGKYIADKHIVKEPSLMEKNIRVKWFRYYRFENSKFHRCVSDVLWPSALPDDDDVKEYVATMKYRPTLRIKGSVGRNRIFSSEAGRDCLESEFLKAGARIRKRYSNMHPPIRPLGYMNLDTLGFGSMLVFYRNCPNNAPLALWFNHPLWTPLFPRILNSFADHQYFAAVGTEHVTGQHVYHEMFGSGQVICCDGPYTEVQFKSGRKIILTSYLNSKSDA